MQSIVHYIHQEMFLKVHSQVVSVVGMTSLPNLLQVFKTKLSRYGDKILTPFPRT